MSKPDLMKQVAALRARIRDLQSEATAFDLNARNRDEAAAHIRAWATDLAATGNYVLRTAARDVPQGQSVSTRALDRGVGDAPAAVLAALIGPDRLADLLIEALPDIPGDALDAATRAARLVEIQRDLDALETEEEALVVQSCGAIWRRADARPAIVLAVRG